MSNNSTAEQASGIGFAGLLGIVFITLKLTGYINWSWLWVLAPLWFPVAAVIVICVIALFGLAVAQARGRNPFN